MGEIRIDGVVTWRRMSLLQNLKTSVPVRDNQHGLHETYIDSDRNISKDVIKTGSLIIKWTACKQNSVDGSGSRQAKAQNDQ